MKRTAKRKVLIALSFIVALVGVCAFGGALWYKQMLSPVDETSQTPVRLNIKEGSSSDDIARMLKENQLIRDVFAFSLYIRLHDAGSKFQSGVYSVRKSQSVSEIVSHLTSGKSDEVAITFYPGATVLTKRAQSDGREVESVLRRAGYSAQQIQEAFAANYSTNAVLFSGKPKGSDLEGYIYGETFYISPDESAKQVIQRSLNQFEAVVKKYGLIDKFRARGLSLQQGITLASIIQKESIGCGAGAETCKDQQQIASVFYNRMKAGMTLGSDVTYQYIADKTGVARDPSLKTPYNTRINKGLPPGPIATPGLSALNAAAEPASTPYKFFLSGDDDVTYFASTNQEHEMNIKNHCKKKCQIL